ncbi:hypothetical protein JN853_26755 [Pseudomonas syringae pv. actinidiae ICMP 9853]|uniref:Uncharacterized protein n=1 Tax=Pseudomonas syringae pv. actinidiae TaxID=103796 RepID=A0A2V0QQQ9_PSESF|nr:hypothetical protein JN853_26755 [Pseudomonas syringae pv. actinidiae ICMP 9853]GBH13148.1 hypothetical protein KPSA1_06630 [Pseudomonas syringae pv. actinidiae]GBH15309.1 hypothetical protein KPSA3_01232 [Pseudomonas syringae pv. actinidiae]
MYFVTLCATLRLCVTSDLFFRLRSPFRPSATDFVGLLRSVTYVALCVVSTIVVKKRFRLFL